MDPTDSSLNGFGNLSQGLEAADAARASGYSERALAILAAVRQFFTDSPIPFQREAAILLDLGRFERADALLREALTQFPTDAGLAIDRARVAQHRGDLVEAVRRWELIRAQFPDHAEAYTAATLCLRQLGRVDEAEVLNALTRQRFPDDAVATIEYAWLAIAQRDFEAALVRWDNVHARFPDYWIGYTGAAMALRELRRFDEADALLQAVLTRFPEEVGPLIDHAALAAAQRDWPAALARWTLVRERMPQLVGAYTDAALALRELGRIEEAEALLTDAITRFPHDPAPIIDHAWIAHIRRDWIEAARRWERMRAQHPGHVVGYVSGAIALREMQQSETAEIVLREAIARFPDDPSPFAEYAQLAALRQDWAEAHRRWTEVQRRFPTHSYAASRVTEVEPRLSKDAVPSAAQSALAVLTPAPKPDPDTVEAATTDLAMRFESLGGQGLGCEFGIFQRDCGAEPLGLLRWADISYEMLLYLLQNEFAGVGAAEHTELFTVATGDRQVEYCTRDRRGVMLMRTFIGEAEVSFDKMYATVCRRLQFLTRKLIGDLRNGSKIFVFRMTEQSLTEAEIDGLWSAIRRYGNNTLLYVRYSDTAHPNGSVEHIKPGLMIGSMDRFKLSSSGEVSALPTASWLALCQAAYTLQSGAHLPDDKNVGATPLAVPKIVGSAIPNLILSGGPTARQLHDILTRLTCLRGLVSVYCVDPGGDLRTIRGGLPARALETAAIYWEEPQVGHAATKQDIRAAIPTGCDIRNFPTPRCYALWPFSGPDPRLDPDPPLYNGGRYPFTDRIAARLASQEMPDDFLFETYMAMCEAEMPDLDALFAVDLDAWRTSDELYDVQIASFVEAGFRARRMFTAPTVRGPDLLGHYARQLLSTDPILTLCNPDTIMTELGQMLRGYVGSRQELPIHPTVAQHFRLKWWTADLRYRFVSNRLTFREYIIDYIRWCFWLP